MGKSFPQYEENWLRRSELKSAIDRMEPAHAVQIKDQMARFEADVRLFDEWEAVQDLHELPVFSEELQRGRKALGKALTEMATHQAWDYVGLHKGLSQYSSELRSVAQNMRRDWAWIPQVWKLKDTVGEAKAVLDTLNAVAASSKQLSESAEKSEEMIRGLVQAATGEFAKIAVSANNYMEQTKETARLAKESFASQGMTAFGNAFGLEAIESTRMAVRAEWGAAAVIGGLLLFLIGLLIAEVRWIRSSTWDATAIGLYSLRAVVVALCVWFYARFHRNSAAWRHATLANRHRRNLCNAFVAVGEKATETERKELLSQILPHLAQLGRTGFLAKEDSGDSPLVQVASVIASALKKKE